MTARKSKLSEMFAAGAALEKDIMAKLDKVKYEG